MCKETTFLWKEITFLEFVEYRKHYTVQVQAGSLSGGGDFGEFGVNKRNARIRWESAPRGLVDAYKPGRANVKWFKISYDRRS